MRKTVKHARVLEAVVVVVVGRAQSAATDMINSLLRACCSPVSNRMTVIFPSDGLS